LRTYVEAAIDFPDEEIDFLADEKIRTALEQLNTSLLTTIGQANQGAILRNGLRLVIAGKPNAGKSSLLNALSGYEAAIVTQVPGTTRDIVSETIDIDGLPVHIIDTAGLRESQDTVEKIGIERARKAIQEADHVLYVVDATDSDVPSIDMDVPHTLVINKLDLLADQKLANTNLESIMVSAKTGVAGLEDSTESLFTARRRHLDALMRAQKAVDLGVNQLTQFNAGELLADELLQAQNALNEITGEFSADDLLGEIFAGFCIGK